MDTPVPSRKRSDESCGADEELRQHLVAAFRGESNGFTQVAAAALDDHDRQAQFDLAARYGKLGDAVWMTDPRRAIDLYDRALATAKSLVSKEQFQLFQDLRHRRVAAAHSVAPVRRGMDGPDPGAGSGPRRGASADRPICRSSRWDLCASDPGAPLVAEGKTVEAREALLGMIADLDRLHADKTGDLTPIFYLSDAYRTLAAISTGPDGARRC